MDKELKRTVANVAKYQGDEAANRLISKIQEQTIAEIQLKKRRLELAQARALISQYDQTVIKRETFSNKEINDTLIDEIIRLVQDVMQNTKAQHDFGNIKKYGKKSNSKYKRIKKMLVSPTSIAYDYSEMGDLLVIHLNLEHDMGYYNIDPEYCNRTLSELGIRIGREEYNQKMTIVFDCGHLKGIVAKEESTKGAK